MKKVFITRKLPHIAVDILSKDFDVDMNEKKYLSRKELIEATEKYDGILSTIPDIFDKDILSYAKKLKVISNYAVGLDNIDVEFAEKSKNIKVFNLPDIVTNSTADLTFAIFLSLIRKICPAKEFVKKGLWKEFDLELFVGEELFNKTFGIIGFGRTGKAVAKRALGFGLKVVFYNRSKVFLQKDELEKYKQITKEELLEISDYISLHVPLNEESKYMINLETMKTMKKKPVLINMARGPIVKTDDLIKALKTGLVRGVGLDVTDPEPLPSNHSLLSFENALIVPHIGTATVECRYIMAKKAAENILFFLK